MGAVFITKHMNITIINDCRDNNAVGRQIARTQALLEGRVNFIGVSNDLEAAGNLVDILDALENNSGVILVNVAPRDGTAKKWGNGTPFCYFWFKKILVLASVDGFTLSLVKKLRLVKSINVLDIPSALNEISKRSSITPTLKKYIINSQFRSFDFLPRVAGFLLKYKQIKSLSVSIDEVSTAPLTIWWIDNFGNCKTTVLEEERDSAGSVLKNRFGVLPFYERLKNVPDKTTALIIGSSGIGKKRFLEVVIQGANAAQKFGISSSCLIN